MERGRAAARGEVGAKGFPQEQRRLRYHDDHGRGDWDNPTAAVLDFCLARPGRYTVWVGSADGTHHNPTTLYLRGNPEHHP